MQDPVGDPDLADVVEQEPVLDARVGEERRVDRPRECARIALHALRVRAGAEVLPLERARERGDGRAICGLQPLALAHLQLGRAYAMHGDTTKARAAYQDFLTLWKDADPDIPILIQAKAEYAELK